MNQVLNKTIKEKSVEKTIDSQSLLEMVNEARKQCGEKEVRNNDFIGRIKDELEGEYYEIFVVQKTNKTTSEKVVMSIKQALLVAARESKVYAVCQGEK
ncbi:hypothetical protein GAF56_16875 [Salmonella enterica]|nr:hypothetical protein [Salmonella enterica]